MRFSLITAALTAGLAIAAPVEKRQNIDATVLQFALTLEHLENVFYKGALQKFSAAQFAAAGFGGAYYNNLQYIAHDEEQHVMLLTAGLSAAGANPVAACTYSFPYTTVQQFVTLASVLEGVGVSAYLGAASLITSKSYLTIAGAILSVEAEHTVVHRSALGEVAVPNPYATPLEPNSVYSLAAMFIKSCPAGNSPLPFKAYPALTATETSTCSGNTYTFTGAAAVPAGSFLTFVSGLSVVSEAGSISGANIMAAIPSAAQGQTYVFVTKTNNNGTFDPSSIVYGPAIIDVAPPAPSINFGYYKE